MRGRGRLMILSFESDCFIGSVIDADLSPQAAMTLCRLTDFVFVFPLCEASIGLSFFFSRFLLHFFIEWLQSSLLSFSTKETSFSKTDFIFLSFSIRSRIEKASCLEMDDLGILQYDM